MSAALQLPLEPLPQAPLTTVWAATEAIAAFHCEPGAGIGAAISLLRKPPQPVAQPISSTPAKTAKQPVASFAFYRKHTENLLKRYLYASMQVGRSPSLLSESVGRGWVSSRRVRTFEDAVIFVLDIERCLDKLTLFERKIISRIVLQEYTHAEAASFIGTCVRTVHVKFPQALDRLTELLIEAELLVLPD